MSGTIDQSFDREKLLAGAPGPGGVVVIDLGGVTRVTSPGVRGWIDALRALPRTYCGFVNCRPAVVSQFNMVREFGCGGQLISFFAPYLCPACGRDIEVLVDLRRQFSEVKALAPPAVRCPRCECEAEFDDIPEFYFFHASSAPVPTPPASVEAFLDGAPSSGREPFRIQKEFEGSVTALWLSGALERGFNAPRAFDGLEGKLVVIAQGIGEVLPEGLFSLAELLASSLEVQLARVPWALARALAAAPEACGRARIISLASPVQCRCGRSTPVEIPAPELTSSTPRAVCTGCGAVLEASLDPEALRWARALPSGAADPEIAAYLRAHPAPPRLG